MNKEVKNIYGGELVGGKDVVYDEEKGELVCKKELEEGKYYGYYCEEDDTNEGFVFWKKDGKVDYDVGDVDEYGDWILVEKGIVK